MYFKIYLLFFGILGVANSLLYTDLFSAEWSTFKLEYSKKYENPTEENFRWKIFYENKRYIAEHNQLYYKGEVTYKLDVNEYADLLPEEFADIMLGFNKSAIEEPNTAATFITPAYLNAPQTVDWRTNGAVTPVKNQGRCGSCWAFSSTGSLEGQHFRKTGSLVSLSEQNLVDCSTAYGNHGCQGGFMNRAFNYIRDNRGINNEQVYPYQGIDANCRFNRAAIAATVSNYVQIPQNENQIRDAVASIGPVSIAINASPRSFQLYRSGVYADNSCNPNGINHAVLIVGYGNENGQDYWLVKNSWGENWGDRGYIKMIRNRNMCGIALYAMYPLV